MSTAIRCDMYHDTIRPQPIATCRAWIRYRFNIPWSNPAWEANLCEQCRIREKMLGNIIPGSRIEVL